MMTKSIMIVGVGGQGTLLASRILGNTLIQQGYDVKVSEVHGMAQRGGSVVTYVRYGETVSSPVVDIAEADIILAFEELEAYRWLPYLKKGGTLIMNTQNINPMPVIIGSASYPQEIADKIKRQEVNLIALDALHKAAELGNTKALNVVLIGVMAKNTDIPKEVWIDVLHSTVPAKFIDVNLRAFEAGYQG